MHSSTCPLSMKLDRVHSRQGRNLPGTGYSSSTPSPLSLPLDRHFSLDLSCRPSANSSIPLFVLFVLLVFTERYQKSRTLTHAARTGPLPELCASLVCPSDCLSIRESVSTPACRPCRPTDESALCSWVSGPIVWGPKILAYRRRRRPPPWIPEWWSLVMLQVAQHLFCVLPHASRSLVCVVFALHSSPKFSYFVMSCVCVVKWISSVNNGFVLWIIREFVYFSEFHWLDLYSGRKKKW